MRVDFLACGGCGLYQLLCPDGTGCPVIASLSGADRILIVTEPTVSGVYDMERVLELFQTGTLTKGATS